MENKRLSKQQKKILNKHYPLWESWKTQGYAPKGSYSHLQELDLVARELGQLPARLHCSQCINDLFRFLYAGFVPSKPAKEGEKLNSDKKEV